MLTHHTGSDRSGSNTMKAEKLLPAADAFAQLLQALEGVPNCLPMTAKY